MSEADYYVSLMIARNWWFCQWLVSLSKVDDSVSGWWFCQRVTILPEIHDSVRDWCFCQRLGIMFKSYTTGASSSPPVFNGVRARVVQYFVFCVVSCVSLFVLLSIDSLSFDLRLLITSWYLQTVEDYVRGWPLCHDNWTISKY